MMHIGRLGTYLDLNRYRLQSVVLLLVGILFHYLIVKPNKEL